MHRAACSLVVSVIYAVIGLTAPTLAQALVVPFVALLLALCVPDKSKGQNRA